MELFDNEEFVQIRGFENYEISRSGKVRNRRTGNSIKTNNLNGTGYYYVGLVNGKQFNFYIHRLVALHFIPNPNNYPCINHKDGDKLNNSIDNLEWCTYSQNTAHAFSLGLMAKGEKHSNAKLTERQVINIKREINQGLRQDDVAKKYGISSSAITAIKRGKAWSHVKI